MDPTQTGGSGAPPADATPPPASSGQVSSSESERALSGRLREETERRQQAEQRAARAEHLEHTVAVFRATGQTDQELADLTIENWSKLPKTNRPSIEEFAAGVKASPPRWAVGYFGQTVAPPAPASSPPAASPPASSPAAPPPAPTGGATGAVPPSTGGAASAPVVTADGLKALRLEARQTGDWSKVQAALKVAKQLR